MTELEFLNTIAKEYETAMKNAADRESTPDLNDRVINFLDESTQIYYKINRRREQLLVREVIHEELKQD